MSNASEDKKKGSEETKDSGKKINIEAVGKILTDMQDDNHTLKSDFVQLSEIISKLTQDLTGLRAEANKLKVVGFRGNIGGTGSTVHKRDETQ